MGDREQLMEILDADSMRPVGSTEDFLVRVRNDGDVFDNGPLADAIIAAGWRLVPEGSIMVSREDVRIVTSVMDGVPLEPSPKRYADAMDRIYAALEDASRE